ncbi:hypothetical protein [Shivajiella indica]|uniref:Uncharacterized protein n=1 Tax=Shivajiella indica TaxID=872115 RepID=A0ABW5B9P4_9BACT
MKKYSLILTALFCLIIFSSCEDDVVPEIVFSCEPTTDFYASFILNYYTTNPIQSGFKKPTKQEGVCWNDVYPYQIASTGTGNCGITYEYVVNPFLATGISLQEYKLSEPEYGSFKRYINVLGVFPCEEFSSKDSFYNLFQEGQYGISSGFEDVGKFIIELWEDDILYTSKDVKNQPSSILITEVEYPETQGTAFVEATMKFSAVLEGQSGKHIYIQDAEVKGRFYRTSRWLLDWDD